MLKRRSKSRLWIPLSMGISVLLLTGFVVQWLMASWSTAEKEMRKDVLADLRKTSDQVLDSMMTRFLPTTASMQISGDSNSMTSFQHFMMSDDTVQKNGSRDKTVVNILLRDEVKSVNIDNKPAGMLIAPRIQRRDSSTEITVHSDIKQFHQDSVLKGLFTKGLGIFVERLSAESGRSDILTITGGDLDTALCKQLLARNWQQKNLRYKAVFSQKPRAKQGKTTIYATGALFNGLIGAELTNRNGFLFIALLPEFLFALILITITLGASLLAWRSFRRQLQLAELRADFVSNISHELKTPVSTVRVALEALQHFNRKSDPKVMDEYLELMSLEMNRLDKLVNQVLVTALLEEKQDYLQPEPTDLVTLIERVIQAFQWRIKEVNAMVRFEKPEHAVVLPLDPVHIEGVLSNLIDNSLKYSGENPVIGIHIAENAGKVMLTISDNGPGIPEQYKDKLFQKFFRVPTGNQHNVKGYGLGLHYCQQVMQQHKGTIATENLPKGCAFNLTFNRSL